LLVLCMRSFCKLWSETCLLLNFQFYFFMFLYENLKNKYFWGCSLEGIVISSVLIIIYSWNWVFNIFSNKYNKRIFSTSFDPWLRRDIHIKKMNCRYDSPTLKHMFNPWYFLLPYPGEIMERLM
jgi:magnesium-transporting ATPase (P-type)